MKFWAKCSKKILSLISHLLTLFCISASSRKITKLQWNCLHSWRTIIKVSQSNPILSLSILCSKGYPAELNVLMLTMKPFWEILKTLNSKWLNTYNPMLLLTILLSTPMSRLLEWMQPMKFLMRCLVKESIPISLHIHHSSKDSDHRNVWVLIVTVLIKCSKSLMKSNKSN